MAQDLERIVEAATRRYLRAYPTASLAMGLTLHGQHYTSTHRKKGAPPAADALYELGTLTEVFTTSLLGVLVEQGKARLDLPLSGVLPRPLFPDEAAGRITLEQLATHTAGLPRLPPNLTQGAFDPADPFGHYSANDFGDFLRGYRAERPVPAPVSESLLGMGLLGHVLGRLASVNYAHAVRDHLVYPLNLSATAARLEEKLEPRLLEGHGARGAVVPRWTFPSLPGAGALRSTVPDLLRFLDAHLGRGDETVVRGFALTHGVRHEVGRTGVALGWRVTEAHGRKVWWRAGATGGFTGFVGFAPDADLGVALLSDHAPSFFAALRGRVPLEPLGMTLLAQD